MKNYPQGRVRLWFGVALLCASGFAITTAHAATLKGAATKDATAKAAPPAYNCTADATWFTAPSLPTEVKQSNGPGDSSFCDFYQFSWQTFAYLMAPSKTNPDITNFEDTTQFLELEANADGSAANSCDNKHDANTFFVRTTKSVEGGAPFAIPQRTGQAGGGATIYDQNGNVVYYDVRFSKNMCDVNGIKKLQNFPGGTIEMKAAWKVIGANDDASQYFTIDAKIGADKNTTKLGMIGFHVAVATPNHPEFVWATFEHDVNSPNCTSPTSSTGWSFASAACTDGSQKCQFNNAVPSPGTTGTPTEICRVYPYGSAVGDLQYDQNTQDIISLNANVQPYLTGSYAVFTNYFNVGALWVSDITQGSYVTATPGQPVTQIANQRGSLRLANTVAETEFQNVNTAATNPPPQPLTPGFVSNCFGCHNYVGTSDSAAGKNVTSGQLSHIFDDIAIGSGQCLDVQAANTINSQQQASANCPAVCTNASSQLKWNGQWTNQSASTGAQLPMTVCGCCGVTQ